VRFFQPVYSVRRKITSKSFAQKFELKGSLGDPLSKFPAEYALIWFSGFRGEDLNVIFYQNMSNLYNRYKSVERKISQKIC
jgi:hypothetical protein